MYGIAEVERSVSVVNKYGFEVGLTACVLHIASKPSASKRELGWQKVREVWSGKSQADLSADPVLSAYRQFLQGQIGASENLLERFLFKGGIKSVNEVVDCLNLVCAQSRITLAAFDARSVNGEMLLDLTTQDEKLKSIGGREVSIPSGELVLRDEQRLISWVGRRDGEATKVEPDTAGVWLLGVRVKGVSEEMVTHALLDAVQELSDYFVIKRADVEEIGTEGVASLN